VAVQAQVPVDALPVEEALLLQPLEEQEQRVARPT
jgi:hypothetical protein